MRLVLDTCVIVSSFRSAQGASRALIDAFDQCRFDLLLSTSLLLEYEDVLTRPEHMQIHGYSVRAVATFIDTLAARAVPVTCFYKWSPQLTDAGDEHVLSTAINGRADAIVTHNLADFLPAAHTFGIQVMTPGRMMKQRVLP